MNSRDDIKQNSNQPIGGRTGPYRPPSERPWEDEETTTSARMTEPYSTPPAARPRTKASLTVISGPETGRVIAVAESCLIGRGRECTVQVEDTSVSRLHARISRIDEHGAYLLEDLNSRNGTFVDGYRIKRHEILDGQRIQLGPNAHFRFSLTDDDEEHLLRGLYESSIQDPLTGIFNRKHFNERMLAEIAYAVRHRSELALLMFDIDHFKPVNDQYGHLAGDKVLKSVAAFVSRTIRIEDIFCRYGGEEFAVIARGIDARGAVALAERVRSIVETARITIEGQWVPVTVSVGVGTFACCEGHVNIERLVSVADQRLYEAKLKGRNCVVGPRLDTLPP